MVKAQVLDHVVFGVDVPMVAERELCLNHERRRIAIPAGGCMIGAGITTLGLDIWDVTVLGIRRSVQSLFYQGQVRLLLRQ